jgi:hypothetical protein
MIIFNVCALFLRVYVGGWMNDWVSIFVCMCVWICRNVRFLRSWIPHPQEKHLRNVHGELRSKSKVWLENDPVAVYDTECKCFAVNTCLLGATWLSFSLFACMYVCMYIVFMSYIYVHTYEKESVISSEKRITHKKLRKSKQKKCRAAAWSAALMDLWISCTCAYVSRSRSRSRYIYFSNAS